MFKIGDKITNINSGLTWIIIDKGDKGYTIRGNGYIQVLRFKSVKYFKSAI